MIINREFLLNVWVWWSRSEVWWLWGVETVAEVWPNVKILIRPGPSPHTPRLSGGAGEWNIDSFTTRGSPPFTRSYVKWNISSIFRLPTKHGLDTLYKLSHLNLTEDFIWIIFLNQIYKLMWTFRQKLKSWQYYQSTVHFLYYYCYSKIKMWNKQ